MNTDPIADMLTRVRNANQALHPTVSMPASKIKHSIAQILKEEGYVDSVTETGEGARKELVVTLKYGPERSRIIKGLNRISTPGHRVYSAATDLPRVRGGLGVSIVSTSEGLLTDREARRRNVGGEIVCEVW
ncbi:MAG: 30S ribosomal protein S8 [Acidimicrobiia bacterium]|nr:30S ribosomal protein S8 [Acidimicrobiia bacterium]NNF69078.1 30S ribosomal protein S8 [Acidimicrobiia bacterium]NNK92255.1 30S ribosomal protein S8 [Acidimicrobiia bacterium]